MTIETTIETLKAEEKLASEIERDTEFAESKQSKAGVDFRPKQAFIPILLIALGLLGLAAQFGLADSRIWNYWWLIFFIVPLMQGRSFGCQTKSVSKK